jgi:acrylyl-CoA reductase (NADPH)
VAFTGEPLHDGKWAGAVDPVGGDTEAWPIRTTRPDGSIVTFGHAGGTELRTSVLPLMYRAISLLGTNITWLSLDLRNRLWNRLATDLRPERLEDLHRTICFEELPQAPQQIVTTGFVGRTVVEISDPATADH